MYTSVTTRRHGDRVYRYLQICENVREPGKKYPRRKVVGSLGNVDHLSAESIDRLIHSLKAFASPEIQDRLGQPRLEVIASRRYGAVAVIRLLWERLGLPDLITQGQQEFDVEQAIFRLVTNRLVDPQSKLSTVEWQHTVEWPQAGDFEYQHFLRAMDALIPQKQELETELFQRVRDLFSIPLRLVWYDLTSSYFEGDGVCSLAEYGHSRDHRTDRSQIVLGLAVTQEGFPIAHEVFPGNTGDVTTVQGVAEDLKDRFGLDDMVLVGDRGLLSRKNAAMLDEMGLRYVMALRTRQHAVVPEVVEEALAAGMERPDDPDAAWVVHEVGARNGVRHVVVYSAFRALHDRLVRRKRMKKALGQLSRLEAAVAEGRVTSERTVTERAGRILSENRVTKYFRWELRSGRFHCRIDLNHLRRQRRLDGIYVLVSNDAALSTEAIVDSYRQLQQVENAFRVLKSLVDLRPIRHWTKRRVLSHVFVCVLGYLIAKVLEQRLARAGLHITAEAALRQLDQIAAVEYESEGYSITQVTKAGGKAADILRAMDLGTASHVLRSDVINERAEEQPTPAT
jgi:transposase